MSNQSESIIKLMTALSNFQDTCPVVPKNKKNHNKGFYAGLEDIMGAIRKPLKEAGLVVSQLPGDGTLTTLLAHFESGEFVSSTITLSAANKDNPQAVGSALTYARRYALSAILGLPIGEEDDDAESAIAPKADTVKIGQKPSDAIIAEAAVYVGELMDTAVSEDAMTPEERKRMSDFLKAQWVKNTKMRDGVVKMFSENKLTYPSLKKHLLQYVKAAK